MDLQEFLQLVADHGLTAQERSKNFWAVSHDGYHYVPIGNPVTLNMTPDEWQSMLSAIAKGKEMSTLSITCPSCQHVWDIEVPDIPWRALPAYKRVQCPSCHATIRVMVQAKEGQVHISFHLSL